MTGTASRARGTLRVVLLIVALVVVLFLLALGAVGLLLEDWRRETRAAWSQVHVGQSAGQVVELLGSPERRYDRESAPEHYYISGYARKVRPITGEVLIYRGNDLVLYVWIGEDGSVEEIFSGSS